MFLPVNFLREIAGNKIFSVKYTKKSGEESKMTCRFGVRKGVTGGGSTYDRKARNYATVFNMHKKGFRTLIVDNIIEVKIGGRVYSKMDLVFMMISQMNFAPIAAPATTQYQEAA